MTISDFKRHGRHWLAAYTRSRHEQSVADQLRMKELEFLLPTFERLTRWSDRVRCSRAPLFPGYVFVHITDQERVPVLETAGVVHLVSSGGQAAVLLDDDVERLRACSLHSSEVEPHPYLRIGHRVRVKHGPFAGWEGTLLEKCNARRLVISVDQIMKSVAINIHGADVESVHQRGSCATGLKPGYRDSGPTSAELCLPSMTNIRGYLRGSLRSE